MSLRISIVTFSFPPAVTGIARGTYDRVRRFLELGHRVHLLHPAMSEKYWPDARSRGIPGVESFAAFEGFSSVEYPTRPHRFRGSEPEPLSHRHWDPCSWLEESSPDLVLVEEAIALAGVSSSFLGGFRRFVAGDFFRKTGTPTVHLFQTDWLTYADRYVGAAARLGRPVYRMVARRLTEAYLCTYFPSRCLLERYRAIGLGNARHLPFHGVDCQRFRPGDNPGSEAGRSDPTLLFVGRIAREKDPLELSELMHHVRKELPKATLHVVGDGPLRRRLERRSRELEGALVCHGEAFGSDLRDWYRRADVFVNPSVSENFCSTNLEAMACGTPVIAANANGNAEQVIEGENGLLARPHDPADLARKTVGVLRDEAFRRQLCKGARRTATTHEANRCNDRLAEELVGIVGGRAS